MQTAMILTTSNAAAQRSTPYSVLDTTGGKKPAGRRRGLAAVRQHPETTERDARLRLGVGSIGRQYRGRA
jgi:hypothetical protein